MRPSAVKLLSILAITASLNAAPAIAEQQADQLIRSVEKRLTIWGLGDVDGTALSRTQLAALHIKLSRAPGRFGVRSIQFKQELEAILRWEN